LDFCLKFGKKLKKIIKKVAPIAAVIPGPWTPFAITYNKANALNNIAKGDGGIGDLLTLGAGGSQKYLAKMAHFNLLLLVILKILVVALEAHFQILVKLIN
jgi:hypothetical protein